MASRINNQGINTGISWCHYTANLWWGCTRVHLGCDHCYAETLSHRWGRDIWGNDKPRMEIKSVWNDLAKQQKTAAASGEMHRVFVGSMMDIFEKPMPLIDSKGNPAIINGVRIDTGDLRNALFDAIDKEMYPNLIFLFLTKRPSNINKYIPENWKQCPPANVMFGTSPVNQKTADKLIPQLLKVNGRKFLSCEPLLGPINLRHIDADRSGDKDWCQIDCLTGRHTDMARPCEDVPTIHWVIVGGESGPDSRPMNPEWAKSLRDQCAAAGIPYFFKQWGNWKYSGGNSRKENIGEWKGEKRPTIGMDAGANDGVHVMINVGKKKAGRELDGKIHDGYPSF